MILWPPVVVYSGIGCAMRFGGLLSISRDLHDCIRSGKANRTELLWSVDMNFIPAGTPVFPLPQHHLPSTVICLSPPLGCLPSGPFTLPKPPAPSRFWVSRCQVSKIWPWELPTQSWDGFFHLQQKPFQKAGRELGFSHFPCWMNLWLQKPITEAQL